MGFIDRNLLPGETIDYRAHLHKVIFLAPALFAAAGAALVGYGLALALAAVWIPGALLLAYGASVGVGRVVQYLGSEFAVTNKRVLIKVGIVNRRSLEMLLSKVETVRVEQSVAGRLLGYGTIVVTGTGGTNEPFRSIADPLEFRRQVQVRAAG
jgi:uncharacterized membrane protein YdbT with pleckstrin-like domain